jgi:hypothetical protein
VHTQRIREGAWAGLIAAAGTAGALIGFGAGRGAPARPLNAIAHLLVGSRAQATPAFDPLLTSIGVLLHAGSLFVWGLLFAHIAARVSGWRLAVAALVFSATIFVVDLFVLPRRLSPGFQLTLSWGEVIATYLVMATLLWLGLSFARGSKPVD